MKSRNEVVRSKMFGVGTMLLQTPLRSIVPGTLHFDLDGEEFADDGKGGVLHDGDVVGSVEYNSGLVTFLNSFMEGGTVIADVEKK